MCDFNCFAFFFMFRFFSVLTTTASASLCVLLFNACLTTALWQKRMESALSVAWDAALPTLPRVDAKRAAASTSRACSAASLLAEYLSAKMGNH